MYYIGIDLGTSAVKLLLMQGDGQIANIVSREYPIAFPHPGWSEQNPADWWDAVCAGIPELLNGFDASQVAGIGAGGQMHGLVVLDAQDKVIRPCILWNDGRTQKQVEYLNNALSTEYIHFTANSIALRQLRTQADGSICRMRSAEMATEAKLSNCGVAVKISKLVIKLPPHGIA